MTFQEKVLENRRLCGAGLLPIWWGYRSAASLRKMRHLGWALDGTGPLSMTVRDHRLARKQKGGELQWGPRWTWKYVKS